MALGYTGNVPPSTGMLGNIASAFGSPNSSGNIAPTMMRPMPISGLGGFVPPGLPPGGTTPRFGTPGGGMDPMGGGMLQGGSFGNIGGMFGNEGGVFTGGGTLPSMPNGGPISGIGQIMAQLHPQHAAALRSIPQPAMQALHQAGMIHPDLMAHLYGGAQR